MVVGAGFGYAIGAIYLRRRFLDVQPVGVAAGVDGRQRPADAAVRAGDQLPDGVTDRAAIAAVIVLGLCGTGSRS